MSKITKCPVCGKEKKPIPLSEYDCEYCGFSNAFINFFASEKSYKTWQKSVEEAVKRLKNKKRNTFSDFHCLTVGNRMVAFLDQEKNKIYVAHGNGRVQVEDDAVEFDSGERNYAVVYRNGTVKVFGADNEFGQKNTELWTDIKHVLVAPNCTYGLTKNGTVLYAGSPVSHSVSEWKNVQVLRSYEDCLAGILQDGSLIFSKNLLPDSVWKKAEKWPSIKDAVLFKDGAAGLTKDGTVVFLGNKDDPKGECQSWKDIIAIEADNSYIYGLSENGQLLVAGRYRKFLDKGRMNASDWKGIMAISCNKAGIGALDENGVFHFAGTMAGDEENIVSACNRFMNDLM